MTLEIELSYSGVYEWEQVLEKSATRSIKIIELTFFTRLCSRCILKYKITYGHNEV